MSEASSPPNAADQQFRRLLPFEILAWVGILFGSAMFAVARPDGWHTDLFVWGLVVGVVGALHNEFLFRLGPRLAGVTGSKLAAARAYGAFRRPVYTISYVVFGLAVGTYSAATGDVWFDLGITIYVAVIWLAVLMAIPLVARRIRAREVLRDQSSEQD